VRLLAFAGSYRRSAAIAAAALGVAAGGGLVGAGAAWSDGASVSLASHHGRGKVASGNRGHRQKGGAGSNATTTTTTTTTTTASTSTTSSGASHTTTTGSKTSASKSTTAPKPKSKPKPKPKPVVQLTATLASTPNFPEREVGLWTSTGMTLTPSELHVTEDGRPVSGLRLTPLSQAGPSQLGVIVVLDESSSTTATDLGLELAAARAIAQERTGNQAFGVITFARAPTTLLPLTSDPQRVQEGLASQPLVAPGESVLPALAEAYSQLHQAGVAAGAVILVAPGSQLASPASEAATSQAGLKLGYQTFTTDVAANTGGPATNGAQQQEALGTNLSSAADIWSKLTSGYLASYRSSASPGQPVTVSVSVDGVPGASSLEYTAAHPPALPAARLQAGPLSHAPALSPYPSFVGYVLAVPPTGPAAASASFWSSPSSIAIVAVVCALLLGAAIWLLLGGVGRSEVERRVSSFIPRANVVDDAESLVPVGGPGVPGILARRRWWPAFALLVDVGQFRRSPLTLVKLAAAASLAAAVVLTLVLGSAAGVVLGLPLGPVVLYVLVRRAVRRKRVRFADQLPSTLQDMAGTVRGGKSLAGSVAAVMDGADEPLLSEFERVVADEKLGRSLEASLRTIAERMKSEDMEQVTLVAALHRRSGSGVAEALDHVAEGARERAELIRELKSLTGQAKLSSRILTGLPLVLFVALSLLNPSYMRPLLHTAGGIMITVLCALMVSLGWFVMRRIVKVEA
jgi:tight adherence protein B